MDILSNLKSCFKRNFNCTAVEWHKKLNTFNIEGNDREDIFKLIDMKFNYIPKYFYKYRCLSNKSIEYVLKEISEGEVYCSSPIEFNDIFDSKPLLHDDPYDAVNLLKSDYKINGYKDIPSLVSKFGIEGEIYDKLFGKLDITDFKGFHNMLGDAILQDASWFDSILNDRRKKLRISCFTENFDNVPMWYHYAGGYSGVCIEYAGGNLALADEGDIYPVIYRDKYFDAEKCFNNKLLNDMSKVTKLSSLVKQEDWSYEKEWRLVLPYKDVVNDDGKGKTVKIGKPLRVLLGTNIKDCYKDKIIDCCKENHISVSEMGITYTGLKVLNTVKY